MYSTNNLFSNGSLAHIMFKHYLLSCRAVSSCHSQYAHGSVTSSLQTAGVNCIPLAGLPKMLVIRSYFGIPSPASGPALSIQTGDIIELICADIHSPWWQVRAQAFSYINPENKKNGATAFNSFILSTANQ